MKIKLLIISFLSVLNLPSLSAQDNTSLIKLEEEVKQLQSEIEVLQNHNKRNNREIQKLNATIEIQSAMIDSLKSQVSKNKQEISTVNQNSNEKILATNQSLESSAHELKSSINEKTLYTILLGIVAIILVGIVYFIFNNKTRRNAALIGSFTDNLTKLENERNALDKSFVDSNTKVLEVIEKQLQIAEKMDNHPTEIDHSLAIAVANELTRIQQNLNHMDANVKGVSQLKNRTKAILTTLNSKQYEVPDLLGRVYHEGDNIIATMELNEDMEVGTNRIKRVIKPQVSYAGKLIQAAEVVVEFNE